MTNLNLRNPKELRNILYKLQESNTVETSSLFLSLGKQGWANLNWIGLIEF